MVSPGSAALIAFWIDWPGRTTCPFGGFASAKPANARSYKAITAASVIVKTVCLVKLLPGLVLSNVTNGIDPVSFPGRLPTACPSLSTVAMMPRVRVPRIPQMGYLSDHLLDLLRTPFSGTSP